MDEKRLVDGTTALAEKQPRVIKIETAERPQNVRLRVAAYTRVSSDSEDQLNSFAAQNRYYTELISSKAEFQTLLEKATDDPAAYGGQFKEILDEQTFLKEKRSGILADNNEQAKANQRIQDAAQTLENASPHITEWDESAVRQLVETVKVLSKDEIAITLKGGIEICQKIMY